jgi:hypothetical protein
MYCLLPGVLIIPVVASVPLGISWLVDPGTKSKIASTLTDFAIVTALVSMPVQAVMTFASPILITAAVGFVGTVVVSLMSARLFTSAPFERVMLVFGTGTGVFLTGLLLLKICDPDFKTPAMRDGSLAYSMNTVLGFVMIPIIVGAALKSESIAIAGIGVALFCCVDHRNGRPVQVARHRAGGRLNQRKARHEQYRKYRFADRRSEI